VTFEEATTEQRPATLREEQRSWGGQAQKRGVTDCNLLDSNTIRGEKRKRLEEGGTKERSGEKNKR